MDYSLIKNELEKTYLVEFDLRFIQTPKNQFIINLAESKYDRFEIRGEVKDNIRLMIVARPEKFGAHFLELMNKSDFQKKQNFVSIWETVSKGIISVLINGQKMSVESFIDYNEVWRTFEIKYTLIPFENDMDAAEICNTIVGMFLALIDYSVDGFEEGSSSEHIVTKYERNPINRKICLSKKGYRCSVCGFDFKKTYGNIGIDFIEVHHSLPVSLMEENHVVDPIKELFPLCSNCHAMIHRKTPPYTIEELKYIMEVEKNENQ